MDINQNYQELSQTNHSLPNKLIKTQISFHGEQCIWVKLFLTNAYDTKCMQSKIQECLYIMLHMPCQMQEMNKGKLYICYKGAPTQNSQTMPNARNVRPFWRCCSTIFGSPFLALWINQRTPWFSGEPVETPQTQCSLHQSPLMTRLPRSPDLTLFWGSTKKPSMTSSCCSCHHAARTWPCWPPGPSNEAYLSSPHLEASPATTFRACSSPAPKPVKSQPAPAILSQESVHTTLSITHHTRKRPSTGPRTTHGPQSFMILLERGLDVRADC
jgi:hypothetical protein